MINTTNAYKTAIRAYNRILHNKVDITFTDGTTKTFQDAQLFQFTVEDDTSNSSSFDIGSTIAKQITLKIDNTDRSLTDVDFYGAAIKAQCGLEVDGSTEWLDKGTFYSDSGKDSGDVITISGYDSMLKFDQPYSLSNLTYPATAGTILRDACSCCGVSLAADTAAFDNDSVVVDTRPEDSSCTFRDVVGWVAQISCKYAKINASGELTLQWYDTSLLDSEGDGVVTVDKVMKGTTTETDDVVITGIRVVEENSSSGDTTSAEQGYLCGSTGYVLEITGNKLIQGGRGDQIAQSLGGKLNGVRFRPLIVVCRSDPSVEAGDIAKVSVPRTESETYTYYTVITGVSYSAGGSMTLTSSAETPTRLSSTRYSEATKLYKELRKSLSQNKTEWEKAVEKLTGSLAEQKGLYPVPKTLDDGSTIYYLCDKPTLEESSIVIELNANGWGASTDGGKTWNTGLTVDGEMITKILNTIGLNADWIDTGALRVKDSDGNEIFTADMDAGEVYINGDCVTIGDKTAPDAIAEALEKANKATTITMILSNEYEGIPTDADGTYKGTMSVQTEVQVLYGSTDVTADCTYTVAKSDSVTGSWDKTAKTYTITALSSDSGWVDITATYLTSMTVTKRFSVSKVKAGTDGANGKDGTNGKDGAPGAAGTDGKTQYTHIAYANSSDGKTDFSVDNSNREYIGMYVDFTEADSTDPTKYKWTLIKGLDGTNGTPGAAGADGKTPYFHVAYATSSDGKTGFSTTDGTNKTYIGQYTDYTEADSTDPTKYTWSKFKGEQGAAGKGVSSTAVAYQLGSSGTTPPTGTWSSSPSQEQGKYLWTKTVITYTDNTTSTSYAVAYCAIDGKNGEDGSDGKDGTDGRGISSTAVTYQAGSSGTTPPSGTWDTSVPTVSNGQYLWTRTIYTFTDKTTQTVYSVGYKGTNGAAGEAVKAVTNYYLATAASSGVTTSTGGWSTTVQSISSDKPYLWNYEVVTGTNGTTLSKTSPVIIGHYGSNGANGSNGTNGKDGVSITGIKEHYAVSSSNSTAPSSWQDDVPKMTTTNKYLWNYETISYSDDTSDDTLKRVIGVYGDTGAAGAKGDKGDDGRTYMLEASTPLIKFRSGYVPSPEQVTFSAYYRDGKGARSAYSGRFVIQESEDGSTWTTVYTSSADETSTSYNAYNFLADSDDTLVTDSSGAGVYADAKINIAQVRCLLYASGGTTTLIDMQSVAAVVDVDALTHEEIFNLLTNNGAIKGIYKEGDQLYINATYILSGTLTLGGGTNGNGILNILSALGNKLLYADNTGLNICDTDGLPAIRLSGRKIIFFFTYKKNSDGSETFTGVRLSKDGVAYTDDSLDGGTVTDDGEIEISFEINENNEEDADIKLE